MDAPSVAMGTFFPKPEPMHIATDDLMPWVPGFYWLFGNQSPEFSTASLFVGDPPTTPASVAKRMAAELTEHWMNDWRKRI